MDDNDEFKIDNELLIHDNFEPKLKDSIEILP